MNKRFGASVRTSHTQLYECIGAWLVALGLLAAMMATAMPEFFTGGAI